jgi:AcrR family transcriptional regulator
MEKGTPGARTVGTVALVSEGSNGDRADSTRKLLLAAAREIFAEKGYDGTRVQDVAIRAGMTTGAIYANFRDKDALLSAAVDEGVDAYNAGLEAEQDRDAVGAELLSLMARNLRLHEGDRPRLLMVEALIAAHRSSAFAQRYLDRVSDGGHALASLLREMQEAGELIPDLDIQAGVHYILCVTFGYFLLEAAGVKGPDQEAWDHLMNRLIAGLAPAQKRRAAG